MNHDMALSATLCQALIAHDACATVVLDADERLVAWNAAAGAAFGFDPDRLRGASLIAAGFRHGGPAIRKAVDAVRGEGGVRPHRVDSAAGEMTVAALRLEDRLQGFVLRRAQPPPAEA
ncbi:MAG TPA: PAS domain-containing protein, partial [Vicinamibacterales bacterium]|nr:PAS domain-containing protein [Vicinamibacterales bacterium]